MPVPEYNLGSPEIQKLLGITGAEVDPSKRQSFIKNLVNRISPADDPGGEYEHAFLQQGAYPSNLEALNRYIEFDPNWKTGNAIEQINKLAIIAHTNPNPIYSYNLSESPLYRGANINPNAIPSPGQEFSFNRFKSFSPDVIKAGSFVKGDKPLDPFNFTQPEESVDPNKIQTLFQIQQDPSGKYSHLITPGAGEPEVIVRPDARYVVEHKELFPFNQPGMSGDLNIVKLRQIYGVDPIGAAAQGAKELVGSNLAVSFAGAATAALDPEVAQQVAQNKYGKAAATTAKNIGLGALAEEGIKRAAPLAGRYAPALLNTASQVVAPVVTGAALFAQGQPGSLTDVLTRKAAQHPVSWLPSVQANPQTDIGARASRAIGNEARYAFQKLLQGKIPYMGR